MAFINRHPADQTNQLEEGLFRPSRPYTLFL